MFLKYKSLFQKKRKITIISAFLKSHVQYCTEPGVKNSNGSPIVYSKP